MTSVFENTKIVESPAFVNSTFPVLTPELPQLRLRKADFDAYIRSLVTLQTAAIPVRIKGAAIPSSSRDEADADTSTTTRDESGPFMSALLASKSTAPSLDSHDGKMLTENADVAFRTSGSALVDLFHELEEVISSARLRAVLKAAWKEDAEATLRIIWNARSIHLGKSSRFTFYRAIGWLAQNHPATLLTNLPWLVRPTIQKKAAKVKGISKKTADDTDESLEIIDEREADSDFELIEDDVEDQPPPKKAKLIDDAELAEFDVKYGVSHGYWKDLLNILALAANKELKVDGNPRRVLNAQRSTTKKEDVDWTQGRKKTQIKEHLASTMTLLENDNFYKALHLTVARLFADQLRLDVSRLDGSKADKKLITMAGKWAPSSKCMHDRHTCIVSSIAELLYPLEEVRANHDVDPADRTLYLKYARGAYQRLTLSPLRRAIGIVERPITEMRFSDIRYNRLPSLAMQRYTGLFIEKDVERFDEYIDRVASGKSQISGATLLPSTLVKVARASAYKSEEWNHTTRGSKTSARAMIAQRKLQKQNEIAAKAADGQWNTLCQRIRDSGKLQSSIAVCDVSASMQYPQFPDKTCPMDSAIGLSLMMAEITEPPFGGAFITFSETPQVMHVGGKHDERSFSEKVAYIEQSNWYYNTDFVAVFEKLILPMAIENRIKPEDMVKQVFVFSDMHFDKAGSDSDQWSTSFERIQKNFNDAGFEIPRLIFWNLAGGRVGIDPNHSADDTAPKPVTAAEENTALVSGYSQGQMKMFLENGQFDDIDEEDVVEDANVDGGDEVIVKKVVNKPKVDPESIMRKAISHEAYRMLKVVD